jgi:signal transduction histidine kinase
MAGMKTKLLHKTLKVYILFSLIVLIISAPLFYYLTQRLYIDEADETLILNKKEFINYSLPALKESDISVWNKLNRNVKINEPTIHLKNDSVLYQSYFDSIVNENEPYRVLLSPVRIEGKSYILNIRINLIESEDLIKSIAALFVTLVTMLLLGLFFITKRLSAKLWEPFYSLLIQIEKFEIDKNVHPELETTDIEEFHRLSNAVTNLIERNTIIYKSQQEFIENAAHELQTPLAVFQAKIDMLMQHSDLTPSQAEVLVKLTESSARLNRLNKNLLLLSKIDNSNYIDKENVSLKELIEKHIDFFDEQAAEKNITIKVDTMMDVFVNSNPVLIEILVSNLLLNAIRHNVQDGVVNVSLIENSLLVSNTGNPEAISTEKLFQRFSKINPSTKGSGLGLAIVKKIVDLNKWNMSYTFQNNIHSFLIKF